MKQSMDWVSRPIFQSLCPPENFCFLGVNLVAGEASPGVGSKRVGTEPAFIFAVQISLLQTTLFGKEEVKYEFQEERDEA
jgi:hypothetical protein